MPDVVLVTGAGRFLGAHLAGRLAANPAVGRVIGVDAVAPGRELLRRMGTAEFVRADIRSPQIAKVVDGAGPDVVVHAAVHQLPGPEGRSATKEANVIGTMQLLAACQQSAAVRKIVLKSTSAVYGSSSRDPAVFTEDMEPKDLPSSGFAKDAVEIEGYVRGFGRRRPEVGITTLRLAPLVGPRIDAMLTRYFGPPAVPTVLGYDARLQLLHTEDALAVLERAAVEDLAGVYNVGGGGVVMQSQAIRRAGRFQVPVPRTGLGSFGGLFGGQRPELGAEQLRFLHFGRVVDTRRLRERFGFAPRWTSRQAFDDFVSGRGLRPVLDPERLQDVERGLVGVLARFG